MKKYSVTYRFHIFFIGLIVFLLHGAKLNSGIIGIDTEDLIHLQDGFYGGWLQTGRQGLVFLKYLLGNVQYNPYYTGGMTLLFFTAAVAAFLLLWDSVGMISKKEVWNKDKSFGFMAWGLCGLLWISHPILAEQFYFTLQSMEIGICIFLTAVSLYLSFRWTMERRPVWLIGSIIPLLIAFSGYQIFVVGYIFGSVSLLLLQALGEIDAKDTYLTALTAKGLLKRILSYVIIFLTAFLLNMLITGLFFGASGYLQNQFFWGQASVKDCIYAIASHCVKVFTGINSVFYHWGFGILALLGLGLLIRFIYKSGCGNKSVAVMLVFFYLAILITPFMMTLLLGGSPAARSQLVLPVVTGYLGYLCIWLFSRADSKGRFWRIAFSITFAVCLISGLEQAKVTESLYYTDRCRYEQDVAMGRDIIQRIRDVNLGNDNLPVIFVGGREFHGNHSCVMGEVIGCSFFNYDTDIEPVCFWSSRRILGFLHTLGADFNQAPESRIKEALEYSIYMPNWPYEYCVQEKDDMIIIKLSHYE